MPKILFIASHRPKRSPSQRFRFEQYLEFFGQHGYECTYSYLISEEDDRMFYQPGNLRRKIYFFLKSVWIRWKDVRRCNDFDLVFVQREAFMTGSVYFERRFSQSRAKLIFDFDDAIWKLDVSEGNRKFGWLKNPGKTSSLIALSDQVIAGNSYLYAYARQFNPKVTLIPTTIDTTRFLPAAARPEPSCIRIGWSGSHTTIKHFEYALPFLIALKKKYGNRICFKVVGDPDYAFPELGIKGVAWSEETEVQELADIDIGIMPLPDDEWAKGKCGLKGLSYMSLEIPTVMSPVGVNSEIIRDGVNGFLADTDAAWIDTLSRLIESPALRKQLGKAGRVTVVESYSVLSQRQTYLNLFEALVKPSGPDGND
jgi:glycosyltransferase involved in cell wall biosynthesis